MNHEIIKKVIFNQHQVIKDAIIVDRDIVLEKNEEERTISVNDKVIEVIPLKHLIKLLTIQASTEQREIVDKVITRQRLNIEYNFVT